MPSDPRLAAVHRSLDERALEPVDDRERDAVAAFRAALARLDRPFDEEADPTHVTASAMVVGAQGVLLHKHKRLGLWIQPGGHIEPGEEPADAALREATEETGLVLRHVGSAPRVVHVDVHPGGRGHTHLDLRFLLTGAGAPTPPPGESPDVRWFSWADAIALADPGLKGWLVFVSSRRPPAGAAW
jgi:8-oxo-dGTP pyrophosphatase MutT (NUDIX family)